jgi:hypothetical protein
MATVTSVKVSRDYLIQRVTDMLAQAKRDHEENLAQVKAAAGEELDRYIAELTAARDQIVKDFIESLDKGINYTSLANSKLKFAMLTDYHIRSSEGNFSTYERDLALLKASVDENITVRTDSSFARYL